MVVARWPMRQAHRMSSRRWTPTLTDYRFPVAVANEPSLSDVRLSVRCKPSRQSRSSLGLVSDTRPGNYYVTRANALENQRASLSRLKGERRQFAGWTGRCSTDLALLRVDAKASLRGVLEDKKVIDRARRTFAMPEGWRLARRFR